MSTWKSRPTPLTAFSPSGRHLINTRAWNDDDVRGGPGISVGAGGEPDRESQSFEVEFRVALTYAACRRPVAFSRSRSY